jgi:hypothetical protein
VGAVAVLFYGKKLIESPLSHGCKTPCCPQNNLDKEEIRKNHEPNICELTVVVKLLTAFVKLLTEEHSGGVRKNTARGASTN